MEPRSEICVRIQFLPKVLGYDVDIWYLRLELKYFLNRRRCLVDGVVIDIGDRRSILESLLLLLWGSLWLRLLGGCLSLSPSVRGSTMDRSRGRLLVLLLLDLGLSGGAVVRAPVNAVT